MLENTSLYPFIVEALAATRHSMAPQTQLKIVASVPPLVGTAVSSMSRRRQSHHLTSVHDAQVAQRG